MPIEAEILNCGTTHAGGWKSGDNGIWRWEKSYILGEFGRALGTHLETLLNFLSGVELYRRGISGRPKPKGSVEPERPINAEYGSN
jgi:hypothetical protein